MESWTLRFDRPAERARMLMRDPSWRIYVLLLLGMLPLSLLTESVWGIVIGMLLLAWAVVAAGRLDLPTGDDARSPSPH